MSSKVYVGNLPYRTTDDELKNHFSSCGLVTDVVIIMDRATNRSKGFGFVTFESESDAQNAISSLNEQEFQGRKLRIDSAREKAPRTQRQY